MMQLDEGQSIDVDNELSEACLTTIHSIIRRCPREVSAYVPNLFEKAMNLLTYDPNYTYNNDEEMKEEDDNGWGSDFEDDQQEAMNDDDDSSWKVRRSAVKIIDAVIKTRPEFAKKIVDNYALRIVERFKERIDDVKVDLIDAFRSLLSTSVESGPATIDTELRH